MIGIITALVMLATGWCVCETQHQIRKTRGRE